MDRCALILIFKLKISQVAHSLLTQLRENMVIMQNYHFNVVVLKVPSSEQQHLDTC